MSAGGLEDFSPRRLTTLRQRAGWSHAEIAVQCGVHVITARAWETGRTVPSETKSRALAAALDIHPAELTNTPRDTPTLRQLRQWRGLRGVDAAKLADIGLSPLYITETYVSPIPTHIRQALAAAYHVNEQQITDAWTRGRERKFGHLSAVGAKTPRRNRTNRRNTRPRISEPQLAHRRANDFHEHEADT